MISTAERARGRWRELLPLLGVDTKFLRNVHGPCPLCGGRDRYRFDDRNGSGSWFCNGCGAGDGIGLVRKLKGYDFATAASEVDRILGTIRRLPAGACSSASSRPDPAAAKRRLITAWKRAKTPGVVDEYLASRGIGVRSDALRGDDAAALYDEGGRLVGYYPAVIAPIITLSRELRSLQVTYLDPSFEKGRKRKFLKAAGSIAGCAVHLFAAVDELAVSEGVETALAFHELTGARCWAALTAIGLERFEPPPDVKRLVIAGDTDESYTGQAAAYLLAKRLRHEMQADKRPEFEIEVRLPPQPGVDWNDVLRGSGAWR